MGSRNFLSHRSIIPLTKRRKNLMRAQRQETVFMVHGLGANATTMVPLALALEAKGYRVVNKGYPSTRLTIQEAGDWLRDVINSHHQRGRRINLVTHSLGGVVGRACLKHFPDAGTRMVMITPPNQGTPAVDAFLRNPLGRAALQIAFGPAALQLGTQSEYLQSLGPIPQGCEVGILAADGALNPLLSGVLRTFDEGHDGIVPVANMKIEGMKDLRVLPYSHGLIVAYPRTWREVTHFLSDGQFSSVPYSQAA